MILVARMYIAISSLVLLLMQSCKPVENSTVSTNKVQSIADTSEIFRIESMLASDAMRGRKAFSPEIDLAADFISAEFGKAGVKPWLDSSGFRHRFSVMTAKQGSLRATLDGQDTMANRVIVLTSLPYLKVTDQSGYTVVSIKAAADLRNLSSEVRRIIALKKNMIVICDTAFGSRFNNIASLKSQFFKSPANVIFILTEKVPQKFEIEAEHTITERSLSNVVGVIPGKSKKNEYVIFSAHYDHIGTGKPVNGDSIYNGANDNAAGVSAVLLLARHFAKLNNNERTLVFVAFTAEEIGGFGSTFFSSQLDPASVTAMFNIEMIGTESKWGKNSAFITGFELSDMGKILQKNLGGSVFRFEPDPYPEQRLFYRSDNATLARLGVPAHTISTAKMEQEPHYHKVSDEIKTLDLQNMAAIIEAIAISAKSIIAGTDTPSRVKSLP